MLTLPILSQNAMIISRTCSHGFYWGAGGIPAVVPRPGKLEDDDEIPTIVTRYVGFFSHNPIWQSRKKQETNHPKKSYEASEITIFKRRIPSDP